MELERYDLVVDHHLERLGPDLFPNHVAHVLCKHGHFSFSFDGRTFLLKEGEAMILTVQRIIEKCESSEDLDAVCVYVSPEFIDQCSPRSNYGLKGGFALFSNPIMQMDKEQFMRLERDFLLVENSLKNVKHHFQEDVLLCATQLMFLDFFDIHASRNGMEHISFQDADIITRFIQMLEHGEYVHHREVSYYADKLFITPKYLSEVCRSVSGKAANYWITRFTITHIRRLLQQREMSFTQISDMFGFSSSAYFSRFVQRNLGVPPSSFRE